MVGRGGLEPPTSALACLKRLCIVIPELADGNGCAKDYSGVIEATPPIPSGGPLGYKRKLERSMLVDPGRTRLLP